MDYQKTDIDGEMVKMTIKRVDGSLEDKKWICKRIDDDPESKTPEEEVHGASESLTEEGKHLEEVDSDDWYSMIPSYLEIEMKEVDNCQLPFQSSAEKNTNILDTQQPTHSHGATDNCGNFCSDEKDLVGSYLKHRSQNSVTNIVSQESSIGIHSSESESLGSIHDLLNITIPDGIIQSDASLFPRVILPQNTPLSPKQSLINFGEVVDMGMRTMPFTNQNSAHSVTSDVVDPEKQGTVRKSHLPNHTQQEALRPLTTNYKYLNTNAQNYDHTSNAPNSDVNTSYNWLLARESNTYRLPIKTDFAEGIGEDSVDNLQVPKNNLKRLSQTCSEIALEPIRPPKSKKSRAESQRNKMGYHAGIIYHCNVCSVTYKTIQSYRRHMLSIKHFNKVIEAEQQSKLYKFQPNFVSRPFGPTGLETLPHSQLLYLMGNQMSHNHTFEAHTMTATNQSVDGRTINHTDLQKFHPETSTSDRNGESLCLNKLQNDFGTKCYAQDQGHMNISVNLTNNPKDIFSLSRHPTSETFIKVNPQYTRNKAPKSDPCAIKSKPNQPENLTANGSLKSEDFQSLPRDQLEIFRVYHCLVCSVFHTDSIQELEQHVFLVRRKPPIDMVTASGDELCCRLCNFKTQISIEMSHHCGGINHLYRLDYYNHLLEGGINAKEKLNFRIFTPVFLFCSACEFSTKSLRSLKAHNIEPDHQHNVSCCMYISKFSLEVEYCFCRPCNVRTPTKRKLLLHVRSKNHTNTLRQYPPNDRMLQNPAQMFFIKELDLNMKEKTRVSKQNEGITFIEKEHYHLKKGNNENDSIENPVPLDLSSPSTALKPLPVSCVLCQKVLPEINALVQHLKRTHDVNDAGLKWLISTTNKIHEEKSLPTEELSNIKANEPKSIVFSSKKSARDGSLHMQGMNLDSSLYKRSVASGQNLESKSSVCLKAIKSEQNIATSKNLYLEERVDEDPSSSQQLHKTEWIQDPYKLDLNCVGRTDKDLSSSQHLFGTERMQDADKLDLNSEKRTDNDFSSSQDLYGRGCMQKSDKLDRNSEKVTGKDFSSSHHLYGAERMQDQDKLYLNSEERTGKGFSSRHFCRAERIQNLRRSSKDTSASQQLCEKEEMLNSGAPIQNPDSHQEKVNINSSSGKHFHKTASILPVGDKKAFNSEENLNSFSSQSGVIVGNESDLNKDSKHDTQIENSSSEHFSARKHALPILQSGLNAREERNHFSNYHNPSSNHMLPLGKENVLKLEEKLNFSSSKAEINVGFESELNGYGEYDKETDDLLTEHVSATKRRSPLPSSDPNVSKERNDSPSSDNHLVTPERLLAVYDFLNAHTPPISPLGLQVRREWYESSSDQNSVSRKWLPLTDDTPSDEHRSPLSLPGLSERRERNSSFSDYNSATHQWSPSVNSVREPFLATESESLNSQSGLRTRRKRNDSSLSDDIFVENERLPTRTENCIANSSSNQHYLLDRDDRSPLDDQQKVNLKENVNNVCDSPIGRLIASEGAKQEADNILVMNKNLDDLVKDLNLLYDCSSEYNAGICLRNSPAALDPQIQARKNIEYVKISQVFSLKGHVENNSSTGEKNGSLDVVTEDL